MSKILRDLPRTVYHGTISTYALDFERIDLSRSRDNLDFGKGFYTTSNKSQAAAFARGKTSDLCEELNDMGEDYSHVKPLIIEFEVKTTMLVEVGGLIFSTPDEKWKEFVYNNRIGKSLLHSSFHNRENTQHFVYGHVADSKIGGLVHQARNGSKTYRDFCRELEALRPYESDQLSFHTDTSLHFIRKRREIVEYGYVYEEERRANKIVRRRVSRNDA